MICREWAPAPAELSLDASEVHLWRVQLDWPDQGVEELLKLLDTDERERAARFHFDRHRSRFIVGRGILRELLGRYLNVKPGSITIAYGSHGKPEVTDQYGENLELAFNLAHSGHMALMGFTRRDRIGVDIEYLRPLKNALDLARRYFSSLEYRTMLNQPEGLRLEAFYNGWTRKEAFIKAIGEGLSYPLSDFDVTLAPGEEVRLLAIKGEAGAARAWTLVSIEPAEEFVGAAVVYGQDWRFTCWDYLA